MELGLDLNRPCTDMAPAEIDQQLAASARVTGELDHRRAPVLVVEGVMLGLTEDEALAADVAVGCAAR